MRFQHWERRLNANVGAYTRLPFAWGSKDCCTFAADAVWALTQKDPIKAWRGTYKDEAGAHALIAEAGGLVNLVEQALASIDVTAERIAAAFGQRGDPCVLTWDGREALGIVMGATLMAKAPEGITRPPLTAALAVWAIR